MALPPFPAPLLASIIYMDAVDWLLLGSLTSPIYKPTGSSSCQSDSVNNCHFILYCQTRCHCRGWQNVKWWSAATESNQKPFIVPQWLLSAIVSGCAKLKHRFVCTRWACADCLVLIKRRCRRGRYRELRNRWAAWRGENVNKVGGRREGWMMGNDC